MRWDQYVGALIVGIGVVGGAFVAIRGSSPPLVPIVLIILLGVFMILFRRFGS